MATIRDVAKLAGVSTATVSNYLNGTKPVSSELSRRIRDAMDRLDYTQNTFARSLRTRKNLEIGVVLPNLDDLYYVQILNGIQTALAGSDYYAGVLCSHDVPQLERQCVETLLKRQVGGLILVSCCPDAEAWYTANFTEKGRPVVTIDRQVGELQAGRVCFDYAAPVRAVTKALLREGYRRICLFSGPEAFSSEAACIRGFRAAYEEKQIPLPPEQLVQTAVTKEQAFKRAALLLNQQQPELLIATSGLIAEGLLEARQLSGQTTEELPILTLGEERWNDQADIHLPSFSSRPAIRIGSTAVEVLLRQLTAPTPEPERLTLEDTYLAANCSRCLQRLRMEQQRPTASHPRPLEVLLLDMACIHSFSTLIRDFEHRTGIPVHVQVETQGTILHLLETEPDRYDVVMYNLPWLQNLGHAGILTDLTGELFRFDLDAFLPRSVARFGGWDRQCLGIPFLYAPQILYYRRDLFENTALAAEYERLYGTQLRPPLTMQSYLTVAEFFTERTDAVPYGISVAAADPINFAPEIYFRLLAFDSRIYGPNGAVTFDNSRTRRAYENLLESIRLSTPDYGSNSVSDTTARFLSGQTAMNIAYSPLFSEALDLQESGYRIGFALVPSRTPQLGGWALGIPRECIRKKDALRFLQWACSDRIATYLTIMGGQSAISRTYHNDELIRLYPWLPLYYRSNAYVCLPDTPQLANGAAVPQSRLDEILCKWAYETLYHDLPLSDALANTQRELERFIGSYTK